MAATIGGKGQGSEVGGDVMEQSPAATPLQRARRPADIPDLGFVCSVCGGRTRSELNGWAQWYTAGERWLEECAHCGAVWSVSLQAERNR